MRRKWRWPDQPEPWLGELMFHLILVAIIVGLLCCAVAITFLMAVATGVLPAEEWFP